MWPSAEQRPRFEEFGDNVYWNSLPWAARRLKHLQVDVVHAHFAWSAASVAWALSTLTGIPWLVTVHARDMHDEARGLCEKPMAADAA